MHNASIKYPALTNVYYTAKIHWEGKLQSVRDFLLFIKERFEKSETPEFHHKLQSVSLRDRYNSYEEYDSFLGAKTSKYKLLFTIN